MKRVLPSYEDLILETEEGEISENNGNGIFDVTEEVLEGDEDYGLGLKPVLPVGKYDSTFKEGDEPTSGEQYLCIVRSQRSKLNKIFSCPVSSTDSGVSLNDLFKKYGTGQQSQLEVDRKWADDFWKCYTENELSVLERFNLIQDEREDGYGGTLDDFILNPTDCFTKLYVTDEISPTLTRLKALREDQLLVEKLLSNHKKWLENEPIVDDPDTLNKFVTWLHALLLLRDSRLTSPEIALLRQLATVLCSEKYRSIESFREIVLIIVKKYTQNDLIKFI